MLHIRLMIFIGKIRTENVKSLGLVGTVMNADALHTQRDFATYGVGEAHADDLRMPKVVGPHSNPTGLATEGFSKHETRALVAESRKIGHLHDPPRCFGKKPRGVLLADNA